ncbi:asrij [Carabus blaptoides fortunei]
MSTQDLNPPAPQPPAPPGRGQAYQFTNEELKVLQECNRDSFFQRCLPIGTLLGVATYYGVQAGHLKPSPRWGATPKVLVASILGYFIGKISYQTKCAERFMQLPDSRLGAILRQRKRGAGFQESLEPGYGAGMSLSPFSSINPSDTYTDVGPANAADLDTNRPEQSGLDDTYRPSLDNPVHEEESMPPIQDKTTSYDELRKQNRDEYQKHRTSSYKGMPSPADVPPVRRPQAEPERSALSSAPKRTNMYGDAME